MNKVKKPEALSLLENIPIHDSLESNVKAAGSILFYAGEYDSALKVWDISIKRNIQTGFEKYYSTPVNYSYLLKQKGNFRLADSILNAIIQVKIEAMSLGAEDYYMPLDIAIAYAIKDQSVESMKYLQIAYEKGWRDYFFTEFNPAFEKLKNDSRYIKIMALIQKDINLINQKLTSISLQRISNSLIGFSSTVRRRPPSRMNQTCDQSCRHGCSGHGGVPISGIG